MAVLNNNYQMWDHRLASHSYLSGSDVPFYPPLSHFQLPTVPLYSILAALGYQHVDFIHLNLDGISMELEVLKRFPFNLVTFQVLLVNVDYYDKFYSTQLDSLLQSKGYQMAKHFNGTNDKIYVHENYKMLKSIK